jgi:hypothetical protein
LAIGQSELAIDPELGLTGALIEPIFVRPVKYEQTEPGSNSEAYILPALPTGKCNRNEIYESKT